MKKVIIKLLNFYKVWMSPLLEMIFGKGCRYNPTCSEYANEAIQKYGVLTGIQKSTLRLLRCQVFSKTSYFDPVV